MTEHVDEFAGQGGSYEMRDGKRARVVEPTKNHPEGNCARDAEGRPVLGPEHGIVAAAPASEPAPERPKPGARTLRPVTE